MALEYRATAVRRKTLVASTRPIRYVRCNWNAGGSVWVACASTEEGTSHGVKSERSDDNDVSLHDDRAPNALRTARLTRAFCLRFRRVSCLPGACFWCMSLKSKGAFPALLFTHAPVIHARARRCKVSCSRVSIMLPPAGILPLVRRGVHVCGLHICSAASTLIHCGMAASLHLVCYTDSNP